MKRNVIPGIIGAVVGGIILYLLIGIPGEMRDFDRRVSKLEGQLETLLALQTDLKDLRSRVNSVESEVSTMKGISLQWGSGWIDFDEALDLSKGDVLAIRVGGTADRVIVRLLPQGESADSPIGVLPEHIDIPPSREILVKLPEDYAGISQISVHGGPNPWGEYPLGPNNGPATIEDLQVRRR